MPGFLPPLCCYFYPRSPRGERRVCRINKISGIKEFLSTLPARGATYFCSPCQATQKFLSTLPARGATAGCAHPPRYRAISIHAPREGSDDVGVHMYLTFSKFLSTLPARGATCRSSFLTCNFNISIHAPREGSDAKPPTAVTASRNFYPRSPRGERQQFCKSWKAATQFLSTLPARGATYGPSS